jgi:hypothetical protein
MKTEITMSRSQVMKLHEFVSHFKEVQEVTIVSSNESGIGESIVIHLEFATPEKVTADLTEYDKW